jgi:hypothetical protein
MPFNNPTTELFDGGEPAITYLAGVDALTLLSPAAAS